MKSWIGKAGLAVLGAMLGILGTLVVQEINSPKLEYDIAEWYRSPGKDIAVTQIRLANIGRSPVENIYGVFNFGSPVVEAAGTSASYPLQSRIDGSKFEARVELLPPGDDITILVTIELDSSSPEGPRVGKVVHDRGKGKLHVNDPGFQWSDAFTGAIYGSMLTMLFVVVVMEHYGKKTKMLFNELQDTTEGLERFVKKNEELRIQIENMANNKASE